MSYGEVLKNLRKKRNLKQEDLAKHMNVDRSTVGKWESDISKPSLPTLVAISNFFNVSLDYFVQEEDEEKEIELTKSEILDKIRYRIEAYKVLEDEIESLCSEYLKR